MVPVDGAAAVEDTDLDHAFGAYALQRLVYRTDEFRILVNVNGVVGARRGLRLRRGIAARCPLHEGSHPARAARMRQM